jgi:hypothetical protein
MIAGLLQETSHVNKEKAGPRPGCAKRTVEGLRSLEVLDLSVGVGADFAIEVDLFVLRCSPFHG